MVLAAEFSGKTTQMPPEVGNDWTQNVIKTKTVPWTSLTTFQKMLETDIY